MRVYDNGVYRDATPQEMAQMENRQLDALLQMANRSLTDSELLAAMVQSVTRPPMPEAREGYLLLERFVPGQNRTLWEYTPDPSSGSAPQGTQENPIPFAAGMEAVQGLWYSQGAQVRQCIQSGVPEGLDDPLFFAL